ncbi:MAG TPA: DUF5667 domain-containing protein [Pseudonocardiaceae bacterium]|nr:DUF5667 domain-containing protein [Pseudonocardiaceae bacterium]
MTPWTRNRQRERFARAADALAGHGSKPDTEPNDPRLAGESAVLLRLNRSANATAPTPDARGRMRAKVMAELPAILTGQADTARKTTLSAPGKGSARQRVTGTRGRLAIAVGAAFCLVIALCGMTMLLSNGALPGDPLYGIRRTVESAAMGLTFGDESKGVKHLGYAADRVSDIESLAARFPDTADSPSGDYLTALADFNSDATAGSTDLTDYASGNGPDVLNQLHDWAAQQSARLTAVRPKLPAEAQTADDRSRTLLTRIETRATDLLARTSCYTVTTGNSDDIGVLPATGPCDRAPNARQPVTPTIAPNPASQPTAPAVANQPNTAPTPTTPAQVPPAHPGATPTAAPPPVTLPTQPTAPTPPILPGPPTISLPLPLPGAKIPPLLPGLPWINIGQ